MYEFARGPLMWVAAAVFLGGIGYRVAQLFRLTKKKEQAYCPMHAVREDSPEERKLRAVIFLQNSLLGRHPVMVIVSLVFHLCLFAIPVLTHAHNLLWRQAWGIAFFSLPDRLIDIMTVVVLLGVLFFFVRRLAVPRVRAVSTLQDHLVLFIAAAPFLTGFMAYHQLADYRTMITVHVLAGELMLAAIPFTKLMHMVFFFFARALFASEFSLGRGRRVWTS
ncbi:MAG: respiratory nitrate reductase subunit gamma [Pirellulales bacterium]